jgi:hypothetical protein
MMQSFMAAGFKNEIGQDKSVGAGGKTPLPGDCTFIDCKLY